MFHFTLVPILLINLIFSIYTTVHNWPDHRVLFLWWIVMSVVLILITGRARDYSMKVQDRVIRLEERLRLQALLSHEELLLAQKLNTGQLLGLRFASDAELPALVKKTLNENLTKKQIKESIVNWKPDYHRV